MDKTEIVGQKYGVTLEPKYSKDSREACRRAMLDRNGSFKQQIVVGELRSRQRRVVLGRAAAKEEGGPGSLEKTTRENVGQTQTSGADLEQNGAGPSQAADIFPGTGGHAPRPVLHASPAIAVHQNPQPPKVGPLRLDLVGVPCPTSPHKARSNFSPQVMQAPSYAKANVSFRPRNKAVTDGKLNALRPHPYQTFGLKTHRQGRIAGPTSGAGGGVQQSQKSAGSGAMDHIYIDNRQFIARGLRARGQPDIGTYGIHTLDNNTQTIESIQSLAKISDHLLHAEDEFLASTFGPTRSVQRQFGDLAALQQLSISQDQYGQYAEAKVSTQLQTPQTPRSYLGIFDKIVKDSQDQEPSYIPATEQEELMLGGRSSSPHLAHEPTFGSRSLLPANEEFVVLLVKETSRRKLRRMGEKAGQERGERFQNMLRDDTQKYDVGFQNEGVVKRLSMTQGRSKPDQKGSPSQRSKGSKYTKKLQGHNLGRFTDISTNLMDQRRGSMYPGAGPDLNHSNFFNGSASSRANPALAKSMQASQNTTFQSGTTRNLTARNIQISMPTAESPVHNQTIQPLATQTGDLLEERYNENSVVVPEQFIKQFKANRGKDQPKWISAQSFQDQRMSQRNYISMSHASQSTISAADSQALPMAAFLTLSHQHQQRRQAWNAKDHDMPSRYTDRNIYSQSLRRRRGRGLELSNWRQDIEELDCGEEREPEIGVDLVADEDQPGNRTLTQIDLSIGQQENSVGRRAAGIPSEGKNGVAYSTMQRWRQEKAYRTIDHQHKAPATQRGVRTQFMQGTSRELDESHFTSQYRPDGDPGQLDTRRSAFQDKQLSQLQDDRDGDRILKDWSIDDLEAQEKVRGSPGQEGPVPPAKAASVHLKGASNLVDQSARRSSDTQRTPNAAVGQKQAFTNVLIKSGMSSSINLLEAPEGKSHAKDKDLAQHNQTKGIQPSFFPQSMRTQMNPKISRKQSNQDSNETKRLDASPNQYERTINKLTQLEKVEAWYDNGTKGLATVREQLETTRRALNLLEHQMGEQHQRNVFKEATTNSPKIPASKNPLQGLQMLQKAKAEKRPQFFDSTAAEKLLANMNLSAVYRNVAIQGLKKNLRDKIQGARAQIKSEEATNERGRQELLDSLRQGVKEYEREQKLKQSGSLSPKKGQKGARSPRKLEKQDHRAEETRTGSFHEFFKNNQEIQNMLSKYESSTAGKKPAGSKRNSSLLVDMLKIHKPTELSVNQLRQMKKHFDGAVFRELQANIISHLQSQQNDINEEDSRQLKYLSLDAEFLSRILNACKVKEGVELRQEDDVTPLLYYILEGVVDVSDANSGQVVDQLRKGGFFKIDLQSSRRRKYKVHDLTARLDTIPRKAKDNRSPKATEKAADPRSGRSPAFRNLKGEKKAEQPSDTSESSCLLRFDLNELSQVFTEQIHIQLKTNGSDLLKYRMFNCLGQEELDFLALRALKTEYPTGEVVLDRRAQMVDKVYLVLQGKVESEAQPPSQDQPERSIRASLDKANQQSELQHQDRPIEIGQHEYFGLREVLSDDTPKGAQPGRRTYVAKGGAKLTTIMTIHARDFRKAMPSSEIHKLKKQFQIDTTVDGTQNDRRNILRK